MISKETIKDLIKEHFDEQIEIYDKKKRKKQVYDGFDLVDSCIELNRKISEVEAVTVPKKVYEKPKVLTVEEIQEEKVVGKNLTEWDDSGNWAVKGMPWKSMYEGEVITANMRQILYGCLRKLMEYEKTGLNPEEVEKLKEDSGCTM